MIMYVMLCTVTTQIMQLQITISTAPPNQVGHCPSIEVLTPTV